MSVLALADVRDTIAAALAPAGDSDPPIHVDPVEAIQPPAIVLQWANPWLEPEVPGGLKTMGPAVWTAHLQIVCVGARVDLGSGTRAIEDLVVFAVDRLKQDARQWPLAGISGPLPARYGGVDYLAAHVDYDIPTTV